MAAEAAERRPDGSRHLMEAPRHQGRSAVHTETIDDTIRPFADVDLSDAAMRAVVEAAPDGIAMVDGDGRIVLANRRLEDLFGSDRGELLGRPVETLVPDGLRQAYVGHRTRYVTEPATRAMASGLELQGRRPDGSAFPLEVSLSPLLTEKGLLTIAIVRDIADRKQAEAHVREAQETVATAADHARIARSLNDTVIRRLFGLGLALEGVAARVTSEPLGNRVQDAVEELDAAIRDLRIAVFGLSSVQEPDGDLRIRLVEVLVDASDALGFVPRLHIDGDDDASLPESSRSQVIGALAEALSIVAAHQGTTQVEVSVSLDDRVSLTVTSDGSSPHRIDPETPGLTVTSAAGAGITLEWAAALTSAGR